MTTALITGATAGIGAAFARRLAADGYHLVLVARDGDRLAGYAAELADRYQVTVDPLAADLSTVDDCVVVEKRLADPDPAVDLLVNNAGISLNTLFLDNTPADEERLLDLNVRAVLRLTHTAVRAMAARGRGEIVNVSSVAGFAPITPGSTYTASKSWVTNFSESVALAARPHGVRVLALCPGYTRTEFHQRHRINVSSLPGFAWLDADRVVAAGLRDLRRGRLVSVPSARYRVVGALLRHGPRSLLYRLVSRHRGDGRPRLPV